jgi:hypothetical protein
MHLTATSAMVFCMISCVSEPLTSALSVQGRQLLAAKSNTVSAQLHQLGAMLVLFSVLFVTAQADAYAVCYVCISPRACLVLLV